MRRSWVTRLVVVRAEQFLRVFLAAILAPRVPGVVTAGLTHRPESNLPASPTAPEPPPARRPIFELTRRYVHPTYRAEFDVEAFAVDPSDPQLPAGQPWAVRLDNVATRTYSYLVDTGHDAFDPRP